MRNWAGRNGGFVHRRDNTGFHQFRWYSTHQGRQYNSAKWLCSKNRWLKRYYSSTIWAKTISGSDEAIAYPVTISVYDHQSLFVGGHINDRLNFDAQSINTNNGRKGFLALIGQTIVVGTEQPSADAFFITVSPNPTAEQVTVSNASEQVNNLLLEIFDASGELVAKQTLSNFTGKTSFDLSASPAGVYFLKASSQDGQQILRVVKN